MKKITDEMLNDYIDNQIDIASVKELKSELEKDEEAMKKLKALTLVDNSLKNIEITPAPDGFTSRIMAIIEKSSKKVKTKVSYFFVSAIGILSLMVLTVMGYAYYTTSKSTSVVEYESQLNELSEYIEKFVSIIQNLFRSQNLTTIGLILTILLLISGYYLIESHKEFKTKINNLS